MSDPAMLQVTVVIYMRVFEFIPYFPYLFKNFFASMQFPILEEKITEAVSRYGMNIQAIRDCLCAALGPLARDVAHLLTDEILGKKVETLMQNVIRYKISLPSTAYDDSDIHTNHPMALADLPFMEECSDDDWNCDDDDIP
jgi:hypothetical protein